MGLGRKARRAPEPDVSVRAATLRDLDALAELSEAFTTEHLASWGSESLEPWPRGKIKAALQSRDSAVYLGFVGGTPAGFSGGGVVRADKRTQIGRIHAVYVVPDRRGSGVAEKLVRALIDGLADRGAAGLELLVATGNAPAQAFFARLGFGDGDRLMAIDLPEREE